MPEQQLLVLVVPGEVRDDVVEALAGVEHISGFSLAKTAGYSRDHSAYSLREQVVGYRDFYRFEVIHAAADLESLFRILKSPCGSANIRYWVTPLLAEGNAIP